MISALSSKVLKDWLLDSYDLIPGGDATIYTMGSEPFSEEDFDTYLRANGLEITQLNPETDLLIVGHTDYNEDAIRELLDWREGKSLKVYSQEMFLAHWTTGKDPFDDEKIVKAFAEDHEALQFLQSCWIDWVGTHVSLGRGGNLQLDSPETSVLKELGYTVGKTRGLPAASRHKILETVFTSKLNNILPAAYIRNCTRYYPNYLGEWGEARSSQRLSKMSDFISSMCRQQKRKGNTKAAADYQEDLDWIESCYRTGRFKFNLNSARVG